VAPSRGTVAMGVVAAVAVAGAAVAAWGFGGGGSASPHPTAAGPGTARVERTTLVDYEEVDGRVDFGDAAPLNYLPPTRPVSTAPPSGAPGPDPADEGRQLVTWLPPLGATVHRGESLFKVDNRPVVLLYGTLPLYRTLAAGSKGPDVKQFEQNLAALGITGVTVDEDYTAATAAAVDRWRQRLGLAKTGTVAPGEVLYAEQAIRVSAHRLRVGDPATGEIMSYTGTTRSVTAQVPVERRRYATIGGPVTVRLPGGKDVDGVVARVGDDKPDAAPDQAVPVLVTVADQAALGTAEQGTARVRFVIEQRDNVLAVPVTALVALAEGGYGLQVVDGATTRYVAVETGLFARGRVEIRSGDIREGTTVVVPR